MPNPFKPDPTEQPEQPEAQPEGQSVPRFVWERMIKRFPAYAGMVIDSVIPLKLGMLGGPEYSEEKGEWDSPNPFEIPALAKGIFYLAKEGLTGHTQPQHRKRRLEISLELLKDKREQKLTPEAKEALHAELNQLFKMDIPGWGEDAELSPRALLDIAGRQYPTWQALYQDLRDTIPGIGELEAIALLEPDKIPEATDRWVSRFKNEPLDLTVIALGVTKAKLLAKAQRLRQRAAQRTARFHEAQPLITEAERYEKAAKYVGRANPEEAPFEIIGAGVRATAGVMAPGSRAYNPETEGSFGINPETGEARTTSIRPEDFGESIGIDKGMLPTAVLSDFDYAAMIEGWRRFYDREGALKLNPTEIREDTIAGAARRFLISKRMILEQRRRHAEELADSLGVPRTTATNPHAAAKAGIEVYQNWEAQQDKAANDLVKEVAKGTTDPHTAGKVAHGHYEDWQLGKKSEFQKEFDEIGEALDQPIRSHLESPPDAPADNAPTLTIEEAIARRDVERKRRLSENFVLGDITEFETYRDNPEFEDFFEKRDAFYKSTLTGDFKRIVIKGGKTLMSEDAPDSDLTKALNNLMKEMKAPTGSYTNNPKDITSWFTPQGWKNFGQEITRYLDQEGIEYTVLERDEIKGFQYIDEDQVGTKDAYKPEDPTTPVPDTDYTPRKGTRERRIKGNWGGRYTARYGVDTLDNFIFSHHADGTANTVYPERLQPRDRSDHSSQLQMQRIGRELDAEDALDDTSSMNDGAVIVKSAEQVYTPEEIADLESRGFDVKNKWVVLSGNGRMAGFEYATQMPEYRQNIENYESQLRTRAAEFDVTEDIGKNPNEVLYREVTDDLTQEALLEFVREANDTSGKGFRSSEIAATDAQLIDETLLQSYTPGDYPSLNEALRANTGFVQQFISKQPKDKQGDFYDAGGKQVSDAGYERIEKALLVSVFDGEAGSVLSRRFADVSDPGLINLRKAVYAALPELAELKYYFKSGERNAELDITDDIANAIFKTQKMIEDEASVDFMRAQGSLFDDPDHENMLRLLHVVETGRTDPAKLTNFLKWYAEQVKNQPGTAQGNLLPGLEPPDKTEILESGLGKNFDEVPDIEEMRTKWQHREAAEPPPPEPSETAPPGILATTRAKLEELRQADSKLLSDPDLDKVSEILDTIIEDAAQDGLTLHDFDKMRTNFRKRLTGAVQNGEMTPIGSAEISSVFYQTLTEDFYDLVEAEVDLNPTAFPPNMKQKIQKAKADYRTTKVEIEESPAIQFLRRTQDNPATLIDELLKEKGVYNPDQLAILKSTLGNDGWTELQASLLDRFIGQATNPETGNIYRDKLGKMIDKLNATNPEKASQLFDKVDMESRTGSARVSNVEKLRQIARRTDLEESVAAQFLKDSENVKENLIQELLNPTGQFNPDEIANLKLIIGEKGFEELQPALLGEIYRRAAANETKMKENIDPLGLRNVLNDVTGVSNRKRVSRAQDRLVELFGEETAEFLEQSALFAERFGRARTWHTGSPTSKLAAILGKGSKGGGLLALTDFIGLQLIHGGYDLSQARVTTYIGIAVLTASWGTAAAFDKYIISDAGRKWLLTGQEIPIPGTKISLTPEMVRQASIWMTENKFELGFTTHKIAKTQTEKEKEKPKKKEFALPKSRNPFAGYGRPPVQ